MKAAQIGKPGRDWELLERDLPEPGPRQVCTVRFSAFAGIRPMIETFPLAKVAEAYNRMATGKVRFRAVSTM